MLMETILFMTRLLSASFVPLGLFIIVHTARRPEALERYAWGIGALGLVALCWLTNGFLAENSRMIVFMYPAFLGFLFLLGPAFYFAITGYRILNYSVYILHGGAAAILFLSGLYGNSVHPFYETDIIAVFKERGSITTIPWSFLGDQYILLALLPVHFIWYSIAAIVKTKEGEHILLVTPIFTLFIAFAGVYLKPLGPQWDVWLWIMALVSELALFIIIVRYLLIDTPRTQYQRRTKLNITPAVFSDIELFLEDEESCAQFFCSKQCSLDLLVAETDIDKSTWKNFLADEQLSFTDLKKRMRIRRAKTLIEEGYLSTYTVESLAEQIGYSSRTSFYSVYKEVTGSHLRKVYKD